MDYKRVRFLSFVLLLITVSLTDEKVILSGGNDIVDEIVSGLGLYHNFKQVFELTTENFKDTVYNKQHPKTWIVEFYNSWCGYCINFAPIYKSLAADIYNWRDVLAIGAVDCTNDKNKQLCRDYEILIYPSIRTFPIDSPESFLGEAFAKGTEAEMKLAIVKLIESEFLSGKVRTNLNLKPYSDPNLHVLWFDTPLEIKYTFLIVQDPQQTPHLQTEVALDFYPVKSIQVRSVTPDNKGLLLQLPTVIYPSVFVIKRDNTHELLVLQGAENHRESIYHSISKYLQTQGIEVPDRVKFDPGKTEVDMKETMEAMRILEEIKKKLKSKNLSVVVFQVDIENAIRYSLYHEIAAHKNIEGDKLKALKNYLMVLSKYFPFGVDGKKFLESIRIDILPKDSVHGDDFSSLVKTTESLYHGKVFLPKQDYLGCKGSQQRYRGYPCSLWTMFHTLTVSAYSKSVEYPGSHYREVLNAMVGYIKYFFGCSECSQHFQQMAVTMPGNVSSIDSSILWLWKAHNTVNKRLAGDATEDPEHKKVQFPAPESCPQCREPDTQEWEPREVLEFLRSMYTNISYLQWSDLRSDSPTTESWGWDARTEGSYSNRLRHDNVVNYDSYSMHYDGTASKSNGDFNIFDISLSAVMYVSSVVISLLVCIKFVMRKTQKKKISSDLYQNKN